MRRLAPIVVFLMLAMSGLCLFTCVLQAAAGPDPHACCHGKSGAPSVAVVQSHLPLAVHTPALALPVRAITSSQPTVSRIEFAPLRATLLFRAVPLPILRL